MTNDKRLERVRFLLESEGLDELFCREVDSEADNELDGVIEHKSLSDYLCLSNAVKQTISAQKAAVAVSKILDVYAPNFNAPQVGCAELDRLRSRPQEEDRDKGNCITFLRGALADTNHVSNHDVDLTRRAVDFSVSRYIREQLMPNVPVIPHLSGHFWYPPGGYMGWHTNNASPGWRVYVTYVEEPGRSFFRYRSPRTGEIITSHDSGLDIRVFLASRKMPLWHAVYSETNRFSFGYKLISAREIKRHMDRQAQ